ncbi:IS3 family transposase [Paenibacillus sp.]
MAEYILYYNTERFQKKLGDRSPVEYRETIAA